MWTGDNWLDTAIIWVHGVVFDVYSLHVLLGMLSLISFSYGAEFNYYMFLFSMVYFPLEILGMTVNLIIDYSPSALAQLLFYTFIDGFAF